MSWMNRLLGGSSVESTASTTMGEPLFWKIIGLLDWDSTGDDEAVIAPAARSLAQHPVEAIAEFERILAQKLYALDTRDHAMNIGEGAYSEDRKKHFSPDDFLYSRCVVVANGKDYYENVLKVPTEFPKDMEFEALLTLSETAYELATGAPFEGFDDIPDYETSSNKAGWA